MAAFAEMHDISRMTTGKITFGANQAVEMEQAQQMATSLDNLANASIQKNTTVNNCVATNATLSRAIQDIQCTLAMMMTNQTPTPGTPALPGQPTGERICPTHWATVKPPWDRTRYCWTHGFKVKVCHTSSTCTSCKAGHQPGATRANTMKGNIFNAGWPTAPPTPPNWQVAPADLQQIEVVNKTILANSTNYKSGFTNPTDLESTAFIHTAASVMLLTKKAPASSTTNTNVQITILQPSGAKMTSTHDIDLLLTKLLADARLAHRLPGLINNLLSVVVLCDAGCKPSSKNTAVRSPSTVRPSSEDGGTQRTDCGMSKLWTTVGQQNSPFVTTPRSHQSPSRPHPLALQWPRPLPTKEPNKQTASMNAGFEPLLHKMDNKTLHEDENFICLQQTYLHYTPPDIQCTNPAECAIYTWKNHFSPACPASPSLSPSPIGAASPHSVMPS